MRAAADHSAARRSSAIPAHHDAPDMVKVWDWPCAFHWSLAFFVLLAWFTPGKPTACITSQATPSLC
jgi:hypothetical protein